MQGDDWNLLSLKTEQMELQMLRGLEESAPGRFPGRHYVNHFDLLIKKSARKLLLLQDGS